MTAAALQSCVRSNSRMSRGQVTLAGMAAGIPVLTITTTGARSGRRRTTPLLGVPFGGDIAIIGTNFGQPGTPGWYYNLRAQPRAEATYRDRSVAATAREAAAADADIHPKGGDV